MKKLTITIITIVLTWFNVYSQGEGQYWYFGNGAGIDFNQPTPKAISQTHIFTDEGCATYYDKTNNLLLSTDGINLYKEIIGVTTSPILVSNGLLGNSSSSNSAIIVPQPKTKGIYYIFTADWNGGRNGINYCIYNFNTGILSSSTNLLPHEYSTEKLTVVKYNDYYWIITHTCEPKSLGTSYSGKEFLAFKLDENQLNPNPIVSYGSKTHEGVYHGSWHYGEGVLKASLNGEWLAAHHSYAQFFELIRFDKVGGKAIGNSIVVDNSTRVKALFLIGRKYGGEFSLEGNYYYFGLRPADIYRVDLTDAPNYTLEFEHRINISGHTKLEIGAFQIAPDRNIYVSVQTSQGAQELTRINNNSSFNASYSKFPLMPTSITKIGLPVILPGFDPDCVAFNPEGFTIINEDIKLESNEIWTGKYYFKPGVIVTVDENVTLDMTNIDIIFDRCSGIKFLNGSKIRANNSVFRTCDMYDTWKGFEFEGEISGIIDECVFKNALIALYFNSAESTTSKLRIANNLFSNNEIGILADNFTFEESITGNHFIIDNKEIDFDVSCGNFPILNNRVAIQLVGSGLGFNIISQNEFVNNILDGTVDYYGIINTGLSGTISQNTFSNLYRSIDVEEANLLSVENNDIEVTYYQFKNLYQIKMVNSLKSSIYGNTIKNSSGFAEQHYLESGIYVEGNSLINESPESYVTIKENNIFGFSTGIQIESLHTAFVSGNNIENSHIYGIYIHDGNNIFISCNIINMSKVKDGLNYVTGIKYIQNDENDHKLRIYSNCIFETDFAIYLTAQQTNAPLPDIINNYLYSYKHCGLYISDFSGNIGSSVLAGNNSFIRNFINSLDIYYYGSGQIISYNNYFSNQKNNCFVPNSLVIQSQNPPHRSIASCGHQINNNVIDELNDDYYRICDFSLNYDESNFIDMDGGIIIDEEYLNENNVELSVSEIRLLMAYISNKYTSSKLDEMSTLFSNSINEEKSVWVNYFNLFYKNEFDQALINLQSMPLNKNYTDLMIIEFVKLKSILEEEYVLSKDEINYQKLIMIDASRNTFSDYARQILQNNIGGFDYIFMPMQITKKVKLDYNSLPITGECKTSPNPVRDILYINYFLENLDGAKINIYTAQGKLLHSEIIYFNAGKATLDCSWLESGLYLISINNVEGVESFSKILKN